MTQVEKGLERLTENVKWASLVPSAISTSFGGAVIGGTFGNVSGAIIGGAAGVVVAVWSELSSKVTHQSKEI
jgi:hypothetical protein